MDKTWLAWLGQRLETPRCRDNAADNEHAPVLIEALPPDLHFLLGDPHYHDEALTRLSNQRNCCLVTSFTGKNNPYPHHDDGVEVRKLLHKTRSIAIENFDEHFNEHFKVIFDAHGTIPTKGLTTTRRFVLSAVFVYQLAILYCFLHKLTRELISRRLSKSPDIYVRSSFNLPTQPIFR